MSVTGCDRHLRDETTRLLDAAGVSVHDEDDLGPARTATLVAVSKAITSTRPDHPQLHAARSAGVPIVSLQQVIADLRVQYRVPEQSVVTIFKQFAGDPFDSLIAPRVQEALATYWDWGLW